MERPTRNLTVINAVVYDPGSAYETAPRGVVVRDGVITFVGSSEQARERSAPGAPVIDAGGRFLMPGPAMMNTASTMPSMTGMIIRQ